MQIKNLHIGIAFLTSIIYVLAFLFGMERVSTRVMKA
jgi:hypothetical protein